MSILQIEFNSNQNKTILIEFWLIKFFFSNHAAEATNLFLRENGIEVLRAMQPQLQKKLSAEFAGIANQLLKHVPRESFLID